jgi:hypothetical protein
MVTDGQTTAEDFAAPPPARRRQKRRGDAHPTGWVRVFDLSPRDAPPRNIGTGHGRGAMAIAPEAVWVANAWSRTVARLARPSLDVTDVWRLRKTPVGIAAGADAVWVVCSNGWLWRIRSDGGAAEGVARLGGGSLAIAADESSIWVLRERGRLIRVEPETCEQTLETALGRRARHMVADEGAIWVSSHRGRRLLRIDPGSGSVDGEIGAPSRVACLATGDGVVWVGCGERGSADRGSLYPLDARTLSFGAPHDLPGQPRALASGRDAVWAACAPRGRRKGAIARLDEGAGTLSEQVRTEWPVYDLAVVGDSMLATMGIRLWSAVGDRVGYLDMRVGGSGGSGSGA